MLPVEREQFLVPCEPDERSERRGIDGIGARRKARTVLRENRFKVHNKGGSGNRIAGTPRSW